MERLWKELTEISWDLHSKDFDIHSALMLLDRDNDEQYDASIVGYNETDANIVTREVEYETAYEAALTPMSDIDLQVSSMTRIELTCRSMSLIGVNAAS